MKDIIKNGGVLLWINAAAAVLALIGMIVLFVSNGTPGYAIMGGGGAIACIIIAFVAILGCAFCCIKFGSQHFITAVLRVASIVLVCVCLGIILSDRVGIAANVLTWDSANTVAWGALTSSIVAVVFMLLAVIVLIVTGFMEGKKPEAELAA